MQRYNIVSTSFGVQLNEPLQRLVSLTNANSEPVWGYRYSRVNYNIDALNLLETIKAPIIWLTIKNFLHNCWIFSKLMDATEFTWFPMMALVEDCESETLRSKTKFLWSFVSQVFTVSSEMRALNTELLQCIALAKVSRNGIALEYEWFGSTMLSHQLTVQLYKSINCRRLL